MLCFIQLIYMCKKKSDINLLHKKTKDKDYLAVSPRAPKIIKLEPTKNLVNIIGKDGNWNITTEMSESII